LKFIQLLNTFYINKNTYIFVAKLHWNLWLIRCGQWAYLRTP